MCFAVATEIAAYDSQRLFFEKVSPGLQETFPTRAEDFHYYLNGFTHPLLPVEICENPGRIYLGTWGLVPRWVSDVEKQREIMKMTLNARCEGVFEKPSFKSSIFKKRCLIYITGFYEYQTRGKIKIPHFIYSKHPGFLTVGGLYEYFTSVEGGEKAISISIVTVPSNQMMSEIHNTKMRMPLILTGGATHDWLNPQLNQADIQKLMIPAPENVLSSHTISKLINSRTENPDCAEIQSFYAWN